MNEYGADSFVSEKNHDIRGLDDSQFDSDPVETSGYYHDSMRKYDIEDSSFLEKGNVSLPEDSVNYDVQGD
jgi:hypothetical protein